MRKINVKKLQKKVDREQQKKKEKEAYKKYGPVYVREQMRVDMRKEQIEKKGWFRVFLGEVVGYIFIALLVLAFGLLGSIL